MLNALLARKLPKLLIPSAAPQSVQSSERVPPVPQNLGFVPKAWLNHGYECIQYYRVLMSSLRKGDDTIEETK